MSYLHLSKQNLIVVAAGLVFGLAAFFVVGEVLSRLDVDHRRMLNRDWRTTSGTVIGTAIRGSDVHPELGKPVTKAAEIEIEVVGKMLHFIYTPEVRVAYKDWHGATKQANVVVFGATNPKTGAIMAGTKVLLMVNAKAGVIPSVALRDPGYSWLRSKYRNLGLLRYIAAVFLFMAGWGLAEWGLVRLRSRRSSTTTSSGRR